jgi:uncharacterized protein YndB with AHSA1/START domain
VLCAGSRSEVSVRGHIATASIEVGASPEQVWFALTDPEQIRKYMFGSRVETDWEPDSAILWKGEYEGRPYEDKGTVLEIDAPRRLSVSHFSPLSGQDDTPENYHTLVYDLEPLGEHGNLTRVRLTQDNNATQEEAEQAETNWLRMLVSLKDVVEGE